jgi:hypothetical protein
MIDYEGMTDFQINCCIAITRGCDVVREISPSSSSVYCGYEGLESTQDERDYCNNPADMWPIIVVNKIKTGWHSGEDWMAQVDNRFQAGAYKRLVYCHKNPLRAAAIVFLMMNEKEI